jgi:hypothetical protein
VLPAIAVLGVVVACAGPSGRSEDTGVSYERHGGIAGESTRLTVTPSGTATLDSRAGARQAAWTRPLSADDWQALRAARE